MDKLHGTIVEILKNMRGPIYRTKLVKLVYMVDEMYFEHFGRTLTGLQYVWDHHGPNAIADAIVLEADELAKRGVVRISPQPNYYGETSYNYSPGDTAITPLPEDEAYVVRDVACRFRGTPWKELVRISKETKPFANARQYDVLHLEQSADYQELVQRLSDNADFQASVSEATSSVR